MDRINFFNSVSGIEYPEMLVSFFDHFIALKNIVEDSGSVQVINSQENCISFSIEFINKQYKDNALMVINSLQGTIIIYGRAISIFTEDLSDNSIMIKLA